jgi:hypothetical protein
LGHRGTLGPATDFSTVIKAQPADTPWDHGTMGPGNPEKRMACISLRLKIT